MKIRGGSGRRAIRGCKHNRGFAGEWAKGEGLLQVKPDRRVGVREVADREILSNAEFEIAASGGQHKCALDGRSPDEVAVDNALDVLQDWIAVIAGFRELGIGFGSK